LIIRQAVESPFIIYQPSEIVCAVTVPQAKAIIPDMPRVEVQQVKALRGIGVMVGDLSLSATASCTCEKHGKRGTESSLITTPKDMMFDNIVMDMMAKRKIETALRQVVSMKEDTRHAERWLEGW